jgi:antitoxin component of MazEF toxin-antitoxin module
MNIVKVRRVGNSNVVTLPRAFEDRGFAPGTEVAVEQLEDGELRIVPAAKLLEMIRAAGRHVVQEDREALQILVDHDAGR